MWCGSSTSSLLFSSPSDMQSRPTIFHLFIFDHSLLFHSCFPPFVILPAEFACDNPVRRVRTRSTSKVGWCCWRLNVAPSLPYRTTIKKSKVLQEKILHPFPSFFPSCLSILAVIPSFFLLRLICWRTHFVQQPDASTLDYIMLMTFKKEKIKQSKLPVHSQVIYSWPGSLGLYFNNHDQVITYWIKSRMMKNKKKARRSWIPTAASLWLLYNI